MKCFFYHADCDKDDDVRSLQRSESVCSTLAPLSSFLKYLLFPAMLVMSSVLAVASWSESTQVIEQLGHLQLLHVTYNYHWSTADQ